MLKCVCRQGLCYRALNPNKSTWCQEEKLQPKAGVHCHSPLASGHSGKIRPLPSHWLFHLPLLRPPGQRYSASRGVPCLCIREQAQQAQDQHCGLPLQAVPFLRQLLQAKGLEGKKQHKTKQNKMHVCWEHSSPLLLPCTKEQAPFSCLLPCGCKDHHGPQSTNTAVVFPCLVSEHPPSPTSAPRHPKHPPLGVLSRTGSHPKKSHACKRQHGSNAGLGA